MITSKWTRFAAFAVTGSLALAAYGGSDLAGATKAPAKGAWAVNTSKCADKKAANAPIKGTVKIGLVVPLSGGVAAAAFSPVKGGFETYIKYANKNNLVRGHTLEVLVADDQYNQDLTPGEVDKLLDQGVNLFGGIVGTANNEAVRDTLNEECVPQLNVMSGSPEWRDVAHYPWSIGGLPPFDVETKAYAIQIKKDYPKGAKVALFTANNEFGRVYLDTAKKMQSRYGYRIVANQTVEITDNAPPTAQVNAIADAHPDAIIAAPLGVQCVTFLTELVKVKAANPGWDPKVFLTNTCGAHQLILGVAGAAANGLYTSTVWKDVGNPEVQKDPKVAKYVDAMTANGYGDKLSTARLGWDMGEITVAVLAQASVSPKGLTRASIINAARNLALTPQLALDGVVLKSNGKKDPVLYESLQIVRYDATTKTYSDVGKLITDFES